MSASRLKSLALACHPLPTVAVTVLSVGLAILTHNTAARAVLLVAAVFTGQLSIGWSNDWIDAARDRASERSDKPAAKGEIAARSLARAAALAAALSIGISLFLGPRAGAAAVLIVLCGWAYNLGLKATAWSWLAYAIAFGSLPAVATLSARGSHWPAWWAIAAGATLGVAAHFANVLPDLVADAATGVRGAPHRIGQRGTAVTGPLLLVSATALLVFGPAHRVGWAGWAAFAIAAVVGIVAGRGALETPAGRAPGRRYFLATVGVAVLDLALFGVSGGRLT